MRILVWGATPTAGWVAGRLQQLRHESIWLTNEAIAKDVQRFGSTLKLKSPHNTFTINDLTIGTDVEAILKPPLDWIMLVMPTWAIEQAVREMSRRIPPQHCPPILIISNGTGAFEKVEKLFPETPLIQGFPTQQFSWPLLPDSIAYETIVSDGLGGIALTEHEKSGDIANLLRLIGFRAVSIHERIALEWSDLFWQIQGNALPVLFNISPKEMYRNAAFFDFEYQQLREAIQIIDRSKIQLVDLPGVATRKLGWQVRVMPKWLLQSVLGKNTKPPSLQRDFLQKTGRSDAAYLHGIVAKTAHDLGINTPVSYALATAVTDLAEGRALPEQFTIDYLQTLIRIATRSGGNG